MPVKSIVITENPVTRWEMFEETLDQSRFASPRTTHRDQGGFYQASFEYIPRSREDAIAFLNTSLGRNVVFYNEHGGIDFEGFINTIKMDTGTAQIKNSLNDMANRVWARYTPVGGGAVTRSNIMESAISQARYGIKEVPLSGGEIDAALADQLAQAYLNLHYWPIPQLDQISLGGKLLDTPRIEVDVYGYFRTLEWRVWNQTAVAGTQGASAEVHEIVGTPMLIPSTLRNDLEAWWTLDEDSDGTGAVARADSSGNGLTLTDVNTTPSAAAKVNNGTDLEFANSECLMRADPPSLRFGNEDFTICIWVKAESFPGAAAKIMGKAVGGAAAQIEWEMDWLAASNRFRFLISNGAAVGIAVANSLGAPSTATWYFIIGWYDAAADTVNIQVNDGAVDSVAFALGCGSVGANFYLGAEDSGPALFWDGILDEAAVWRRVLTAAERTALYNNGYGVGYSNVGDIVVLGGVGQFVRYLDIEANGSLVTKEYDADRKAADILQSIADLGNSDYRIFVVGMEEDRQFYYREAAPPVRS